MVYPESLSDTIGAPRALSGDGLFLPEAIGGLTESEIPAKATELAGVFRVDSCGIPVMVRGELKGAGVIG